MLLLFGRKTHNPPLVPENVSNVWSVIAMPSGMVGRYTNSLVAEWRNILLLISNASRAPRQRYVAAQIADYPLYPHPEGDPRETENGGYKIKGGDFSHGAPCGARHGVGAAGKFQFESSS